MNLKLKKIIENLLKKPMKKKPALIIFFFLFLIVLVGIIFIATFNSRKNNSAQGDKILNSKVGEEKLPQKSEEVSLIAVGDVMLSRNVAKKMKAKGKDYPFLKTKDYLKTGDLVFGNLESPIIPGREINTGEMVFRADPGVENTLKEVGFSVLSLANNHTPNFGSEGLKDTFSYLGKAGIKYSGAGENESEAYSPVYLESKGLKFAFLAYNDDDVVPKSYRASDNHPGTAFLDIEKMTESVKETKEKVDFVIVSFHAGNEYTKGPNQSQTNFAKSAIDAGAEMVIGHHPHVIQKAEIYQGKYIFYSLGNFIFDQMWSKETREGLMLKIIFSKKGVEKIDFLPVLIEDFCQPRILEDQSQDEILEKLQIPLEERKIFLGNQQK